MVEVAGAVIEVVVVDLAEAAGAVVVVAGLTVVESLLAEGAAVVGTFFGAGAPVFGVQRKNR